MTRGQGGADPPPISNVQPLSVRVPQAATMLGIGRSKLYELIAADEIDTIKVGTITLIPMASLKSFLERKGLL